MSDNPLKNGCENANTLVHGGVHWWCWHICKGEVGEVLEKLELKKRSDGS
jgi:hypothetical protein